MCQSVQVLPFFLREFPLLGYCQNGLTGCLMSFLPFREEMLLWLQ